MSYQILFLTATEVSLVRLRLNFTGIGLARGIFRCTIATDSLIIVNDSALLPSPQTRLN